jgi:hypothetical protein
MISFLSFALFASFQPDGEEVHPNELDDEMEPEDMDEIDEMDEEGAPNLDQRFPSRTRLTFSISVSGLPIMDDEDDERDEMTEGEEELVRMHLL